MEPLSVRVSAGNRWYIHTGCSEEHLIKGLFTKVGEERTKGWCYLGLGVLITSKPEEVRESGGRRVICKGVPYKNVAFIVDVNILISLAFFPLISG